MAMGAPLTLVIVVQLVQQAPASCTAWPMCVAGLSTAADVGRVVGLLLDVPRERR
jgi:hypothetical protein